MDKEAPIIGTISDDGSIHIDRMALMLSGANEGYIWDAFDTYWTKQ